MASWWKLIAQQMGAMDASGGSYQKRVANFLNAQGLTGNNWEQRIGSKKHFGTTGSYSRRLVDFTKTTVPGSYARNVFLQGELSGHKIAVPSGTLRLSPTVVGEGQIFRLVVPGGGIGVHQ